MRRASSRLLAGGLAIAIVALASTMYQNKVQRDFSARTAFALGSVVRTGAFLGKTRHSHSEWFCWVEYQFSPEGGAPRKNWGMWPDACDLKRETQVSIQYVVGNPDTNRPAGGGPSVPALLWWFVAGVMMVIGVLRRGSEETDG